MSWFCTEIFENDRKEEVGRQNSCPPYWCSPWMKQSRKDKKWKRKARMSQFCTEIFENDKKGEFLSEVWWTSMMSIIFSSPYWFKVQLGEIQAAKIPGCRVAAITDRWQEVSREFANDLRRRTSGILHTILGKSIQENKQDRQNLYLSFILLQYKSTEPRLCLMSINCDQNFCHNSFHCTSIKVCNKFLF